ncbi:HAD domain-containing protein [Streptomyces sp. CBMA29]|uniref:HAD domain-containing protein n=1 Tax=Streptomyces sp. CBMA29 TaxID=1896314 RepID=UPI001661EB1B|nr:HAD domain-containing protein [Streptomyces sp. CBMA29]MBD0734016.1 hypothetical protein [Streptomyces sp. CBMA29]
MRPLLFLDVDGVLNPDPPGPPDGYTIHHMRPAGYDGKHDKPLHVRLNRAHGALLQALPYDLVWATSWGADANTWIGPHLDLPELPVVSFPPSLGRTVRADRLWISYKTATLTAYAAGRPFAWVDDEITPLDNRWVREHRQTPALLHWVPPHTGLTDADFATLTEWAKSL